MATLFVSTLAPQLLTCGLALAFVLIGGPAAIRWLKAHCGERVASGSSTLDDLHKAKNRTPTMGGLLLVGGILFALLITYGGLLLLSGTDYGGLLPLSGTELPQPSHIPWRVGLMLGTLLAFTLIGLCDDWIKLTTARRGLSARQKLLLQLIAGLGSGVALLLCDSTVASAAHGTLPWLLAPLWTAVVLVSSSNAVNLTDGLDGLAGGCVVIVAVALGLLCQFTTSSTEAARDVLTLLAALAGATLGFLWFNRHPARVFMGDTGSLPLGAVLGLSAVLIQQELAFLVAAGVFVVETLSVLAQVAAFRLTGKRVLACSPLHNHFVFRGWPERRIVRRFWAGAVLCACVSLLAGYWRSFP